MVTIAPQPTQLNKQAKKVLPQKNKVEKEPNYPSSDGKPMAETTKHRDVMVDIIYTLIDFFIHSLNVLVSGDNFLYTIKGDPSAVVAPDVYVVFGVPVFPRDTYKVWEEGKPPDFVMEITSPKTFKKDLGSKRDFYEVLGVPEYFLFDPKNQAISPPLRGFRLKNGRYYEIALLNGRLYSEQLGLEFVLTKDNSIRIFHPSKGEFLVLRSEQTERANAEAQARLEAESEIERLKAELASLRANRE